MFVDNANASIVRSTNVHDQRGDLARVLSPKCIFFPCICRIFVFSE